MKGGGFGRSSVPEKGIVRGAEDRKQVVTVGVDPLHGRETP